MEPSTASTAGHISVCTYNILAAQYTFNKNYPYCDKQYLRWKSHRRHLVLSNLSKMHCDIICLQEVDKVYDIQCYLHGQGYISLYQQRPNRKADGLLIAFKRSKFELDSSIYVSDFNQLSPHDMDASFIQNNIGMMVVLRLCSSHKTRIVVANTHLYWNPQFENVKLLQTVSLLHSIEYVLHKHSLAVDNCRLIICGDFNSEPRSKVYEYVTQGCVDCNSSSSIAAQSRNETKTAAIQDDDSGNHKTLRIICDLRKAAQWLALIEVDASYFAGQSTSAYEQLFALARSEVRIIVTRNTQITSRADCPPFVLIGPRLTQRDAFQFVVNHFSIEIDFKKKHHRENITDCLSCPKCLFQLQLKELHQVQALLKPSRNENLKHGQSAKGVPLEFYQCTNTECNHLVYHRQGWLDRLHRKRSEHYNETRNSNLDLHKNGNNGNHTRNAAAKAEKAASTTLVDNREQVWAMQSSSSSSSTSSGSDDQDLQLRSFGQSMNALLNSLCVGQTMHAQFSKRDATVYELTKQQHDLCVAVHTGSKEETLVKLVASTQVTSSPNTPANEHYPCDTEGTAKILLDHVYRKRRPIILGVEVCHGKLQKNDRIFAVKYERGRCSKRLDLGIIADIQCDSEQITVAKAASKSAHVCLKLDTEHTYGRQFDDSYFLVVRSRKNILQTEKLTSCVSIQVVPRNATFDTYPTLSNGASLTPFKHAFKLKSAYREAFGHEPVTTNHTQTFSGCLDYVFVSDNIDIKACDELPRPIQRNHEETIDVFEQLRLSPSQKQDAAPVLHHFLPDKDHPSDHLPIKAVLLL